MKLFYLTSSAFALTAIALRRIKVSRFAELNDPFELLAVSLANTEHIKAFCSFKEEINKSKGLLCFSDSWSNPVLWGHYADKHAGIALGFEATVGLPVQAIYAKHPLQIPIDETTGKLNIDITLVDELLRTKFVDWEYENEWRVFVQLDHSTREGGMYFYDFSPDLSLSEVILGPRCELPISKVRAIVSELHPTVVVRKSSICFQSFHVIEENSAT